MVWSAMFGCRNDDRAATQFEMMKMASANGFEATFPYLQSISQPEGVWNNI
jgi:hypothetical protein